MNPTRLIIRDDTDLSDVTPPGMGRGLELARPEFGRGYGGLAEPFPDELIIHPSEWPDIIEERKRLGLTMMGRLLAGGITVKNQEITNYCWMNSPIFTVEVARYKANDKRVILSPASAACRIKNFRNDGGWGREAVEFLAEHGACPIEVWPANAIDRQYFTQANVELAKFYRVGGWWELEPRNLVQTVSCLLRGIPVSAGLNWWRHQVTYVDADWVDGAIAIIFANSYGTRYGTRGYGTIQGRRMLPDDAIAPRTARAA